MKLYRFEKNDTKRLETIKKHNIFISNPKSFNDLDDCSIDGISDLYDKNSYERIEACIETLYENKKNNSFPLPNDLLIELKKFFSHCKPNERDMLGFFRDFRGEQEQETVIEKIHSHIKQSTGVCCFFSGRPSHPLMWAHYADSHKGFCIEYHASRGDKPIDKVNYSTSTAIPSIQELLLCPEDTLIRLLTTKSFEWNHEEEFRLIYLNELKNGENGKAIPRPQNIKPTKIITGANFINGKGRKNIEKLGLPVISYNDFINKQKCQTFDK